MRTKPLIILLSACFCLCFMSLSQTLAQDLPGNELTAAELGALREKKLILKTKTVDGSPWPEITYYALIEATPLESMGIFSALDYQKEYVPNIIKSTPVKHVSATEVLTEYELKVPFPLPNAKYIHGSNVSKHNLEYALTWYKVESSSADEVKGESRFVPFEGKTLWRYRSYIVPKSKMASLVKSFMLKDVEKSVLAIRDHIEKLKRENSPLLSKYSEFILRQLKGEFVYKNAKS